MGIFTHSALWHLKMDDKATKAKCQRQVPTCLSMCVCLCVCVSFSVSLPAATFVCQPCQKSCGATKTDTHTHTEQTDILNEFVFVFVTTFFNLTCKLLSSALTKEFSLLCCFLPVLLHLFFLFFSFLSYSLSILCTKVINAKPNSQKPNIE